MYQHFSNHRLADNKCNYSFNKRWPHNNNINDNKLFAFEFNFSSKSIRILINGEVWRVFKNNSKVHRHKQNKNRQSTHRNEVTTRLSAAAASVTSYAYWSERFKCVTENTIADQTVWVVGSDSKNNNIKKKKRDNVARFCNLEIYFSTDPEGLYARTQYPPRICI